MPTAMMSPSSWLDTIRKNVVEQLVSQDKLYKPVMLFGAAYDQSLHKVCDVSLNLYALLRRSLAPGFLTLL